MKESFKQCPTAIFEEPNCARIKVSLLASIVMLLVNPIVTIAPTLILLTREMVI